MGGKIKFLFYWVIFVLAAAVIPAQAADRVALVIGNAGYKASPLKNPVNDARDMKTVLESVGFKVILKTDADKGKMLKAIDDFADALKQSEVGLFFFAGHGMQIKGENFLIPVHAHITSETDVEYAGVHAGRVLGKMEGAGNKMNIVILDACRDNPFKRRFRTQKAGLARMDAPVGSIIAYATAPGSVAADGDGRNGIYTKNLIKQIRKKGLSLNDLFMEVRKGVLADTGRKQVPWEESSLTGRFYFAQGSSPPVQKAPSQPAVKKNPYADPHTGESEVQKVDAFISEFKKSVKKQSKSFFQLANYTVRQREKLYRNWFKNETEKILTNIYDKKEKERFKRVANTELDYQLKILVLNYKKEINDAIEAWKKNKEILKRDRHYYKLKSGIVYDERTDLEWYAGKSDGLLWQDAKKWVEKLELEGGGWRMPSVRQLKEIHDIHQRTIDKKRTKMTPLFGFTGHRLWAREKCSNEYLDGWWTVEYHWTTRAGYHSCERSRYSFTHARWGVFAVRPRKK